MNLTLTRSQHMALVSLVGEAMAREPNMTWADCSQSPPVETTVGDLFQLLMNLPNNDSAPRRP